MNLQILFPILILIAGFFYFIFPFINKKFFQRPYLTLEIEPNKGITSSRKFLHYSLKHDRSIPVNNPETISVYELNWKFDLTIRNNSEYAAYSINLYSSKVKIGYLNFIGCVNENKPLPPHDDLIIPFEYTEIKECKLKNIRTLDTPEPQIFDALQLLLNYHNSKKRRFNSLFILRDTSLYYKRISKRKIKKNWH